MTEFAQGSDGARIAYERVGEGPPVLFIHGFAASRAITWRNTNWYAWAQRSGRQIIAVDCRGHGESDKPHEIAAYDDRIMTRDFVAVLDAAGLSQVDCVGYSMGGYMTMNLMRLVPERVGRAVVAGVGATHATFWPDRNELIAQGLLAERDEDVTHPLAKEFRSFAIRANNDLQALAACMRRNRLGFEADDIRAMANPVLVICGEDDRISGRPEPLAALFPHGEAAIVPRRNHHSAVGDPHFKQAVKTFLEQGAVPRASAPAS